MITEILSTLKINKLTQAQYERELEAGRLDPNALYLTPDEDIDLSKYVTEEELEEILRQMPEGSSPAIIDVVELPTEDINENAFYRVLNAEIYYSGILQTDKHCYVVETLPATGEPATDATFSSVNIYYALDTGAVMGYLTAELGAAFGGYPAGWYPVEALFSVAGFAYGGIVSSFDEMTVEDMIYILIEPSVKYRNANQWKDLQGIGWHSKGLASVVFNSLSNTASGDLSFAAGLRNTASGSWSFVAGGQDNTASGERSHVEGYLSHAEGDHSHAEGTQSHAQGYSSHAEGTASYAEGDKSHAEGYSSHSEGQASHAEGYSSQALGEYSHAEGDQSHAEGHSSHSEGSRTHAEGSSSHAEGALSHAQGHYSHAEGHASHAEGDYSHAQGYYSHAEGEYSHAEGYFSDARGRSQHVQGEYNLLDPVATGDFDTKGKYAHIVGNGTLNARSNAHTIDWNGLGWFAGGLKVGGTGQDDPNAVRVLTENDKETIIRVTTANENLNNYISQGTYYFVDGSTPVNAPENNNNGYLSVMPSTNYIKQLWFRAGSIDNTSSQTFVRTAQKIDGVFEWSSWEKFITNGDVIPVAQGGTGATNAITAAANLGLITGLNLTDTDYEIPNNANLNDYITPGAYRIGSAAVAASLSNIPYTSTGGRLIVMYTSHGAGTLQILVFNAQNRIYFRTRTNTDTWGQWYKQLAYPLHTDDYGDTLPAAGTKGRIFFKKA